MNDGLFSKAQNYDNKLIAIRLITGSEVIGIFTNQDDTVIKIQNPLCPVTICSPESVSPSQLNKLPHITLVKYSGSIDGNLVEFNKNQIESYGLASQEYQEKYKTYTEKN